MFSTSAHKKDDIFAIVGASVVGSTIGAGVTFFRDYEGGVALKYVGDFLGHHVTALSTEKLASYVAGVSVGTGAIIALTASLTKLVVDETVGGMAKKFLPAFCETNAVAKNIKNCVVYAAGSAAALAAVGYGAGFVGVSTSAALTIGGTYVATHLIWKTAGKVVSVFFSTLSMIGGWIHNTRIASYEAAVVKCTVAYQKAILDKTGKNYLVGNGNSNNSFNSQLCTEIDKTALSDDTKNKTKVSIKKTEDFYKKSAQEADWAVIEARINLKQANLNLCQFRNNADDKKYFKNANNVISFKDVQIEINNERKDLNTKKNNKA